ncbi:hypothetical protein [Picosynechococcus sp. PCC 11901]|uniref:hypothetical protein n=1 Tax=Picosynechococcus sp. PCC 11901 TaxID=2579791 RepID=UPI002104EE8F|nr:hypothetical protein [Picosynechococcus sp. PCC 11901]
MIRGTFHFATVQSLLQQLSFGKKLPTALYLHISALKHLPPELQDYEAIARKLPQGQVFLCLDQVQYQRTESFLFGLSRF